MLGTVVSTNTLVVVGVVNVNSASFPAASLIVPLLSVTGDAEAIPSLSVSPDCTVYRKTNALVPLPELYIALRDVDPTVMLIFGVPPLVFTVTLSL